MKQFGSRSRPTFCWSSSGFKLIAKGYWQTTKLSTGMQRVMTGKYFIVQYIVAYRDIHAYVYHKYSDTLNTFNMLCPLNKAKVIFKGSSLNQFYFPMLNGTLSFLQKYLFLLLIFQFCIIYGNEVKNVQVTSKLSPPNHFITKHILSLKQFHQLS